MTTDNPIIVREAAPAPVDQVYTWILSGATDSEITAAIATLWPDVRARPLITAAMKRIVPASELDRDWLAGWAVDATRLIFQRAMQANDLPTALRAVKQLRELGRVCGQDVPR